MSQTPPARPPVAARVSAVSNPIEDDRASTSSLLHRLRREVFQAETLICLRCRRDAYRLGNVSPADVMHASASHAECALQSLPSKPLRLRLSADLAGTLAGTALATFQRAIVERVISCERSYRGALLALRHGVDLVRVLRDVAHRHGDRDLETWCDAWLLAREPLVEQAEAGLAWFAQHIDEAARPARAALKNASL